VKLCTLPILNVLQATKSREWSENESKELRSDLGMSLRAGKRSGNESKELESSLRMLIPHGYITVQKNVWLPRAMVT